MSKHLTAEAARRLGDQFREDNYTEREARAEIDDWFAATYGWPLSRRQAEQRDEFLAIAREAREGE